MKPVCKLPSGMTTFGKPSTEPSPNPPQCSWTMETRDQIHHGTSSLSNAENSCSTTLPRSTDSRLRHRLRTCSIDHDHPCHTSFACNLTACQMTFPSRTSMEFLSEFYFSVHVLCMNGIILAALKTLHASHMIPENNVRQCRRIRLHSD